MRRVNAKVSAAWKSLREGARTRQSQVYRTLDLLRSRGYEAEFGDYTNVGSAECADYGMARLGYARADSSFGIGDYFQCWPTAIFTVCAVFAFAFAGLAQEPYDGPAAPQCWTQVMIPCGPESEAGKTCWRQVPIECPFGEAHVVEKVESFNSDKLESFTSTDKPEISISAGGLASIGSGTDASIEPMVQILASAPLYNHLENLATRLEIDAALTALAGETIDLNDVKTFRSLEFTGRFCQPLSTNLYFAPCVEAGFATRLHGDVAPRYRAARWFAFTLKIRSREGDYVAAGISADERLDTGSGNRGPYYRPAALISGSVAIANENKFALRLVTRAVLHLRIGSEVFREAPPDSVVLGLLLSR